MRFLLLMLVVAACGPNRGGGGGGDRCDGIAAHLWTTEEGPEARRGAVVAAIADTCRTDGWDAELIACLERIANLDNDDSCDPLFSDAQRKQFERAWEAGESDEPAAPAGRYACLTYRNVRDVGPETQCFESCAAQRAAMQALVDGGAVTELGDCVPASVVWCIEYVDDDPTCWPSLEDCQVEYGEPADDACVERR